MKILMLSDVYFPRVNGVSASMQTFARELTRLGHAVTIVAPDYGASAPDEAFEVIRVAARVIAFDPEDRLMRADAMSAARVGLAQRDWDIVHVHTPFRAHQLGVWLGGRSGCPVVESYHTFFEEYAAHYLPWLPPAWLRFAARGLSRRLCREVDHLIVPTTEMAAVLRGYGIATPQTVIPTGIRLDEFDGGNGARFRRELGIADDQPALVTVSRLAAEKNIGFLVDAARVLVDEFPRLIFIIAGEGPEAPRLRRHVASLGLERNVRFVGNLDRRTRLLDCYKAGDLFVFASPTETQGLVLLEAMALGVPIVSTAVMGTATVLKDAGSARVSEPRVDAFAGHVADLLKAPAQRRRLSAAGPVDAQAWSAHRLIGRVEELYTTLAEGRRPAAQRDARVAGAALSSRP